MDAEGSDQQYNIVVTILCVKANIDEMNITDSCPLFLCFVIFFDYPGGKVTIYYTLVLYY